MKNIDVNKLEVEKIKDGVFEISYQDGDKTLSLTAKAFDNDEFVTDAETFKRKLMEGALFFVRPGAGHINEHLGSARKVPKENGTCSFISFINKESVKILRIFDKNDMSSTPFEWQ